MTDLLVKEEPAGQYNIYDPLEDDEPIATLGIEPMLGIDFLKWMARELGQDIAFVLKDELYAKDEFAPNGVES